jgi:hypothetical protein
MADDKKTKPTIETVLERMAAQEERMSNRMAAQEERIMNAVNERIDKLEERIGIRLDRVESVATATRGEMLDLRADFRELRTQIREHFPAVN